MAQPATAAWRLESVPSPQGRTPASLYGVSCTSATACVAVGASDIGLRSRAPLAERWDGRRWSIQPTVSPPAPRGRYTRDAELSGVSCTSRTQCVAVGSYRTGSVTGAPLVEAWNGARWSLQTIPSPPGAFAIGLTAVSCTSSTACTAVGNWDNVAGPSALVERWDGTIWMIQPTPSVSAPGEYMFGISCTSTAHCMSAGDTLTVGTSVYSSLAESWDGASWSIGPTINPRHATDTELHAVSCTSSTACVAVGSYDIAFETDLTLAERWDGLRWSIEPTPKPAHPNYSQLDGVSCTSRSWCAAVGFDSRRFGAQEPLVELWDGGKWSIQPTPSLTHVLNAAINGVSCVSRKVCTAVGSYLTRRGNHPLAEATSSLGRSRTPTSRPSDPDPRRTPGG
jgi:hypothetical protein